VVLLNTGLVDITLGVAGAHLISAVGDIGGFTHTDR
jgi:hypothetical protein